MRTLYPFQEEALAKLRFSISKKLGHGKRRPVLCSPTGSGKTVLASAIVSRAADAGKRVIFVVPALSLIDQTVAAFWEDGIRDVGVIQGTHEMTNMARPIQVASVQTLMRRDFPMADLVVIDECHVRFDFIAEWMTRPEWADVPFIGLSATPWSKGLGKVFDDLIVVTTTHELIDQGYLSRFRVRAPSHPDLSGVKTIAGDYHEGQLSEVMSQPGLVADVVETWRMHGEDRSTLCFAVDCSHARFLQRRFTEAGIPCGYVDAQTPREEREVIRQQFEAGEFKVVCSVGCLTTGIDWDVRCIVLARPTKSEILFVQIIGRGLRTAKGKDGCLILDHSDTHLRLGFVTDVHHDALDDGTGKHAYARKAEMPKPKECPSCRFLKPARARACPSCGFVAERQWKDNTEAGALVELSGSGRKRATPSEKLLFYAQLRGLALERGKSDKWVLANFRQKFHEWPHDKHVQPMQPGAEVRSWVKSRQIAWVKSRERAAITEVQELDRAPRAHEPTP